MNIKHIEQANWFKTLNHYPKTVDHIYLLVSIIDKVGVFDKFDLSLTSDMDSQKLNILYAILRIMNKIFNIYSDYAVKKIFRDKLMQTITPPTIKHIDDYELFLDQLTQDIDHFVCLIFKAHYPKIDKNLIKIKLISYLKLTFQKSFYATIMRKMSYEINDQFYQANDSIFNEICHLFIEYTNNTLLETYDTMKMFLDNIFNITCSDRLISEINIALQRHINLQNLFKESCMEIEIYSEQKIHDELAKQNTSEFESDDEDNKFYSNKYSSDIESKPKLRTAPIKIRQKIVEY